MSQLTGETTRTQGPRCRRCKNTEARCAWNHGACCSECSHWLGYDRNGDEVKSQSGGRRRLPVEHGSDRGYFQHRVRHERPCPACRAAHSLRVVQQKQAS